MRQVLKRHPDFPCDAVAAIEVEAVRRGAGALAVRFVVTGALGDLALPPPATSARTDELWRHTCFEAFVRPGEGPGYAELNFAPSSQWAAYRFDGYRAGMADLAVPALAVAASATDERLELSASVDLGWDAAPWHVGLCAVIEERGGRISYWALGHPAGRPDFHHADCFRLELPAPGTA